MANININKIVRSNFSLKQPWIAAKNTSEIVNSYVQKFYKQIPDNFKNDLIKPPIGQRTENRFPFRKAVTSEKFSIPIIANKPTSKLRSNGYRSPTITTRNSFIAVPRRLPKSPNFKIYPSRRYASSVSSSKSSYVRSKPNNKDEEYRRKIYTPAKGIQFQAFRNKEAVQPLYTVSTMSKFVAPARIFNETNTVEVSNAVCNGLMSIDKGLKKKICVVKQKDPNENQINIPRQESLEFSFRGWNQPYNERYFKTAAATPVVKMPEKGKENNLSPGSSSFRLMPVKVKPFRGKFSNTGRGSPPNKESPRIQSNSNSANFRGFGSKSKKVNDKRQSTRFRPHGEEGATFKGLEFEDQSSNEKSENESVDSKYALGFACMSRADRSARRKRLNTKV